MIFSKPMKTGNSVEHIKPTLTSKYLKEMWVLYFRYYDIDYSSFLKKMDSNDFYALYTNANKIIGFTGFRYKQINTPLKSYQTIYIGQTVMDENFRGQALVPRTCFSLFLKHFIRHPFRPLYVWCDALTFKPYMIFANAMDNFYPSYEAATPPDIKALLANLGNHYYGENYDPETNVVKKYNKIVNDPAANISAKDLENPHIAFYNKQNPEHINGNGFLVIAPINFRNMFNLAIKCIRKEFFKLWKK